MQKETGETFTNFYPYRQKIYHLRLKIKKKQVKLITSHISSAQHPNMASNYCIRADFAYYDDTDNIQYLINH